MAIVHLTDQTFKKEVVTADLTGSFQHFSFSRTFALACAKHSEGYTPIPHSTPDDSNGIPKMWINDLDESVVLIKMDTIYKRTSTRR
jgi:hypothetical protein